MSNPEKESKARSLLAEAQRNLIEAERLLDGHAAAMRTTDAILAVDDSLDWLEERKEKTA